MTQMATITDQRQLTIPISFFYEEMFRAGEKVVIEPLSDGIKIIPALSLVQKLKGSIPVPAHLKGKNIDKIIAEAKEEYFAGKK
ncbi:hypothetical protein HY085_01195 [Candidatus Gottesmanbacteria bacterium]|nr:hypothetical protein [Candidatus Gottesmanbacteria bacterium]